MFALSLLALNVCKATKDVERVNINLGNLHDSFLPGCCVVRLMVVVVAWLCCLVDGVCAHERVRVYFNIFHA